MYSRLFCAVVSVAACCFSWPSLANSAAFQANTGLVCRLRGQGIGGYVHLVPGGRSKGAASINDVQQEQVRPSRAEVVRPVFMAARLKEAFFFFFKRIFTSCRPAFQHVVRIILLLVQHAEEVVSPRTDYLIFSPTIGTPVGRIVSFFFVLCLAST